MTSSTRWLLWALGLLLGTCLSDLAAYVIAVARARALPAPEAGRLVTALLGGYLLIGLGATALFWWRGARLEAGIRTVATIAFLLAQGLLFAFLAMATLLATHR